MRVLLVLLALATTGAAAQPSGPPAWEPPPPGAYPETMAITGVVRVASRELRSRADRLAAFVGGEVRGVAASTLVGNRRVFFLSVAGNSGDGALTFQAYDALVDGVFDLQPDIVFDPLDPTGSVAAPVVWTPLYGGGPPAWEVDPAAYSTSMIVVGRVLRSGTAVAESGARVGAFLGGELRGAAALQDAGPSGALAFLTVYGDPADAGPLDFRVYLPSADRTFAVAASVPFVAGSVVGSVASPVPLPVRGGAALTGPQGWRMLAPPGAETTAGTLLAPLWTQGFPGADDAGGQANVYSYAEPGGGYSAVGAASETWPRGQGRLVYVYEDDDPRTPAVDGGFPKTLPAIGLGPTGGFRFGLTYTPGNGEPRGAGWNLLGNPFDEPVDWDLGWTRTGVSNSVYIWDPAYLGGGYRVWNGVAGSLTDGVLPRGSAFWAQAMASAPVMEAPASARVLPAKAAEGEGGAVPVVTLRLQSSVRTGLASEGWVTFQAGATDGLDSHDAWALPPLVDDYVELGSAAVSATQLLTVDARGADPTGTVTIPLAARAVAEGTATGDDLVVTWPGLDVPDTWELTLVDTETGARVDLRTAAEYRFTVTPSAAGRPGLAVGDVARPALVGFGPAPSGGDDSVRFRLDIATAQTTTTDDEPGSLSLGPPTPNPSRGQATLTFTLSEAGTVRLDLYDLLGRHVLQVVAGPRSAGVHAVTLDTSRLPPGLYLARLDAEARSLTTRVTILR